MKIKKILSALVASAIVTASFTACSSDKNPGNTEMKKIGVIQISQHPSLNTIRDSFTEEMISLGYIDGENCVFEYQDAQGDVSTANSIIQSYKADNKDIVVAIATPTAQAAANISDTIPVVFSAVTDPVDAKLVDSLEKPGQNITGTSDAIPIDKILDFALELTPDIKTLGYIYNSGEPNSVSCLQKVKAYCEAKNINLQETAITNTSEVQQAAQVLAKKCDAMFTPIDNTIATAMDVLSEAAVNAEIPLYVGADSMVKDGGLATVGIEYTDLGKETAKMADMILKGEKNASDIPVKVFNEELYQYINTNTAEALGISIPDSIKNDPQTILIS